MANQVIGVNLADHRVAELRLGVVDRVSADDRDAGLAELGRSAADDLLQQSGAELVAWEGRDPQGEQRSRADGVDVAEGVGRGDGAEL